MTTARTQGGFTLIEIMITVVIVAILSAIAVPSYRSYVLRANRTVAKTALVDASSRLESYFIVHKKYTKLLSDIQLQQYLMRDGSTASADSSNVSLYQLSIKALSSTSPATCPATGDPGNTSYVVVATPVNAQLRDTSCLSLCLTSTGIRSAAAGTADSCWSR